LLNFLEYPDSAYLFLCNTIALGLRMMLLITMVSFV
jgi:hypothetical protein